MKIFLFAFFFLVLMQFSIDSDAIQIELGCIHRFCYLISLDFEPFSNQGCFGGFFPSRKIKDPNILVKVRLNIWNCCLRRIYSILSTLPPLWFPAVECISYWTTKIWNYSLSNMSDFLIVWYSIRWDWEKNTFLEFGNFLRWNLIFSDSSQNQDGSFGCYLFSNSERARTHFGLDPK